MRPDEVVVSDEESGKSDSAVKVFEAVCSADMELVSAVKAFDELLERSEFFRYGVKVLNADDFLMREGFRESLVYEVNPGEV